MTIASTPKPPYFAVIFTSQQRDGDAGYAAMADEMESLAKQQPGYLGMESVRDSNGLGITVSYWESEDAIMAWGLHARHQVAQQKGRDEWYEHFITRVCKVERDYGHDFNLYRLQS